jgi:hypothetical protein
MYPVPGPLHLGKSGATEIKPGNARSAARNSDHYSTDAVLFENTGNYFRLHDPEIVSPVYEFVIN